MTERIKGIVNAVSGVKEHDGKLQIGWTLKENNKKWYNVAGEEKGLKKLLQEIISKGNEVEFNYDSLGAEVSSLVKTAEKEKESSDWEEDIVNFETLLTMAHDKKKPFSIHTEMLAVDLEKKYALFKATVSVIGKEGNLNPVVIFEAHGDATNDNVKGDFIKPHFIRLAETRAIVRALRWYTNNGCSEEEK